MLKKFFRADKGFTLVELLIAITILGISAGIVLHSFSTSAKITIKSRSYGEATGAADNIAEAVNAYSIDDFLSGSALEMLNLNASNFFRVNEPEENEEEPLLDYKKINHQVVLKGIKSGMSDFDAVVSVSNGDPEADAEEAPDDLGIYELNNYEIAQYTKMDGSFSQPWKSDQNPDLLADISFTTAALAGHATDRDANGNPIYRSKNRLISINVYTDIENSIYMHVVYNYTFTYNNSAGLQTYIYTWEQDVSFMQNPAKYIPKDENDEPTVFFMYYPYYDAKKYLNYDRFAEYNIKDEDELGGMTPSYYDLKNYIFNYKEKAFQSGNYRGKDLIVINNLGNVPTRFFIVKQKLVDIATETTFSSTDLYNKGENASYRACIIERLTDSSLVDNYEKNQIYTNAGVSFVDNSVMGQFLGQKIVNTELTIKAYTTVVGEGTATPFIFKNIINTKPNPRYYKITVDIYPAGTIDPQEDEDGKYTISIGDSRSIYSFVGSKLE